MGGKFEIGSDMYVICECFHATDFALKHIEVYTEEEIAEDKDSSTLTTTDDEEPDSDSSECNSYSASQNLLVYTTFAIFLIS